jgi:hypothetical protein
MKKTIIIYDEGSYIDYDKSKECELVKKNIQEQINRQRGILQ